MPFKVGDRVKLNPVQAEIMYPVKPSPEDLEVRGTVQLVQGDVVSVHWDTQPTSVMFYVEDVLLPAEEEVQEEVPVADSRQVEAPGAKDRPAPQRPKAAKPRKGGPRRARPVVPRGEQGPPQPPSVDRQGPGTDPGPGGA